MSKSSKIYKIVLTYNPGKLKKEKYFVVIAIPMTNFLTFIISVGPLIVALWADMFTL